MVSTFEKVGPKRFVQIDEDGTRHPSMAHRICVPGKPTAARPSVHGKIPANGSAANSALAAQLPNGVGYSWMGGKKATDARWLVVTDWNPVKGDPDLERGVLMSDAAVFEMFGGAPAVKAKAKPRVKAKAVVVVEESDSETLPPVVQAADDPPPASTVEPPPDSERVNMSDEVAAYLDRLLHEPKRIYAHAYAAAIASGSPVFPADPGTGWAVKVRIKLDKLAKVQA
jgi:hypothetical protein